MCVEGVKSFFFAVSTPQARGFGRSPDTRQHRKASAVSGSDGVRQLHQLAENGCEQFGLGPLERQVFLYAASGKLWRRLGRGRKTQSKRGVSRH